MATATQRLPYLRGLDGLRALAVAAVLAYHAGASWLPGGFLGVELFFVVSGFLITAGLLAEWRQEGKIAPLAFWQRRARRLLPAVILLILATLTVALLLVPGEVAGLREDALASLAYVTNWYLIFDQQSYFEAVGRPSLLLHLWSLAVEEQFYIVWPLLLAGGLRFLRPRATLAVVVALAVGSAALMIALHERGASSDRLYYGTDTRAAGLLIGAALAFVWQPWLRPAAGRALAHRATDLAGVAGLALLVWLFLTLDEFDERLYTGGLALVSLTSALVIAIAVDPRTLLSRVLGVGLLRWLGVRSYSIYLWHWPVFALTRPDLDVPYHGAALLVIRLGLAIALADLSYQLVERPAREGGIGRLLQAAGRLWTRPGWQGRAVVTTSTACLALLLAGFAFKTMSTARPEPPAYLAIGAIKGVVEPEPSAAVPDPELQAADESEPQAPEPQRALLMPPPFAGAGPLDPALATGTSQPVPASPQAPPIVRAPPRPSTGIRLSAIGDSVLLGAANEIAHQIGAIDVDAAIARQAGPTIQVLRERAAANALTPTVLIQIGNNGLFTTRQFDEMMSVLTGHQVLVVNLRVPKPWEGPNNAMLAEAVQRYPNAHLVDWHSASANHPELFTDDGTHLMPAGARIFADLVVASLP